MVGASGGTQEGRGGGWSSYVYVPNSQGQHMCRGACLCVFRPWTCLRDTFIEVKVGSASQRTVAIAPDMGGFVWNEALAFEVGQAAAFFGLLCV